MRPASNQARDEEVRQRYAQGEAPSDIARTMGLGRDNVSRITAGMRRDKDLLPRTTRIYEFILDTFLAQGYLASIGQMEHDLDMSRSNIHYHLQILIGRGKLCKNNELSGYTLCSEHLELIVCEGGIP